MKLALPLALTLGLLVLSGDDAIWSRQKERVPSPVAPQAPNRFSCNITISTRQGPSTLKLRPVSTDTLQVVRVGKAYRVTIKRTPDVEQSIHVRLNNGDDTEFDYWPRKKKAGLALDTVLWNFAHRYPEKWDRYYDHPPAKPILKSLQTFSQEQDIDQGRRANSSLKTKELGSETVDGKKCRVIELSYLTLLDRTGRVDPNSRITRRISVWNERPLILREVIVSEDLGDVPPRPLVTETITTIQRLVFDPMIPPGTFDLPRGTTCTVFADYATPLPAGVARNVVPGSGLEFEIPVRGAQRQ